nr:hypothetical protein [Tanacetum cinerariifolium]
MNVYTSVLTFNEVKNLAAEYIIPLDLHPCVPPSGLTMNRLPVNKIVATNMSQFLKFSMAGGIPEKSDHQKDVEYENERVLAAKRKAQAAKYRAVGKRATTEGGSHRPMKKKTAPVSFALLDSEADESNCSGFGTHYSASPLNTIIPNDAELTIGGDGLVLESANRMREDTDHNLDNMEDTIEVNSPLFEHSPIPNTLLPPTRICMFALRETGCVIMSWGKLFFWRLTSSSLSEGQSWWRRCWFISFFVKLLRIMYILPPTWVTDLDEYKKSLSDVFNLAIAAGWLEGVMAACSEKDDEPKGTGPTLSGNVTDVQ